MRPITWVSFARVQPIAFKACLLRAQRHFHATDYTRAGRVNTQTTHKCSVERVRAGACFRMLPAGGLWRALPVVPPCRAPESRAAYLAAIPFTVRRVPSKAMPVTGFGTVPKKELPTVCAAWCAQESESVAGYCLQGACEGRFMLSFPAARPKAERRTLRRFLSLYAASPQRQYLK